MIEIKSSILARQLADSCACFEDENGPYVCVKCNFETLDDSEKQNYDDTMVAFEIDFRTLENNQERAKEMDMVFIPDLNSFVKCTGSVFIHMDEEGNKTHYNVSDNLAFRVKYDSDDFPNLYKGD